ncbi:hypothetical protein V8E52_004963 [Russula decolorans]
MSFESGLIQSPSTESTDALRPGLFFAPPPQHPDAPPPELFDQEVAELDLDFELFPTFRNSIQTIPDTIPFISTPVALTDSTVGVYGGTYSPDFTKLDNLTPFEIESYHSLNNGLYGTHGYIHSAVFSNGPPSIPPLHPTEAQFDFGTSDLTPNLVGISSEDLSTAMQPLPTSVVTTPLPVHVTPASEAQMAPAPDRPFKCPHSPHSPKRKHTRNKSKPFKCAGPAARTTSTAIAEIRAYIE